MIHVCHSITRPPFTKLSHQSKLVSFEQQSSRFSKAKLSNSIPNYTWTNWELCKTMSSEILVSCKSAMSSVLSILAPSLKAIGAWMPRYKPPLNMFCNLIQGMFSPLNTNHVKLSWYELQQINMQQLLYFIKIDPKILENISANCISMTLNEGHVQYICYDTVEFSGVYYHTQFEKNWFVNVQMLTNVKVVQNHYRRVLSLEYGSDEMTQVWSSSDRQVSTAYPNPSTLIYKFVR